MFFFWQGFSCGRNDWNYLCLFESRRFWALLTGTTTNITTEDLICHFSLLDAEMGDADEEWPKIPTLKLHHGLADLQQSEEGFLLEVEEHVPCSGIHVCLVLEVEGDLWVPEILTCCFQIFWPLLAAGSGVGVS